jgi:hypothetical protein
MKALYDLPTLPQDKLPGNFEEKSRIGMVAVLLPILTPAVVAGALNVVLHSLNLLETFTLTHYGVLISLIVLCLSFMSIPINNLFGFKLPLNNILQGRTAEGFNTDEEYFQITNFHRSRYTLRKASAFTWFNIRSMLLIAAVLTGIAIMSIFALGGLLYWSLNGHLFRQT